jgi:uncharacterized repeat protein (TIGR03803 family)
MLKAIFPVAVLSLFAGFTPYGVAQDVHAGLVTIYNFQSGTSDAYLPNAAVMIDRSGVMIGTTVQGGTTNQGAIFSLAPPASAGDPWKETVLYNYEGATRGFAPLGPLVAENGNLYGVSSGGAVSCGGHGGSACGLIVALSPPAIHGEAWHSQIIHSFGAGTTGWAPSAAMTPGADGVLYGVTRYGVGSPAKPCAQGCGTVFSLTPPAAKGDPWVTAVIYQFKGGKDGQNPITQVSMDANGVLYGSTQGGDPTCSLGCGTIYSLTPPATPGAAWTHAVLHIFTAKKSIGGIRPGQIVVGNGGILYGTTSQGGSKNFGTVFALRPPTSTESHWTEKLLYSFMNTTDGSMPFAPLAIGTSQALYGTTSQGGDLNCTQAASVGCGVVFQMKPPATKGGPWTFNTLHAFSGGTDGGLAVPGIAVNSKGVLFGSTSSGGANSLGTVFQLVP